MSSASVNLVARLGGELVTYLPWDGAPKTFKALVDRRPMQVQGGPGGAYGVKTLELLIPNDAINGVTSIKERHDRVRFKKSLDDANDTEFTVNKVMQEDAGLVAGDGGAFRVMVQA